MVKKTLLALVVLSPGSPPRASRQWPAVHDRPLRLLHVGLEIDASDRWAAGLARN